MKIYFRSPEKELSIVEIDGQETNEDKQTYITSQYFLKKDLKNSCIPFDKKTPFLYIV